MGQPQSTPGYVISTPHRAYNYPQPTSPQSYPHAFNPILAGRWETTAYGKLMKSRNLASSYAICGCINVVPPNNSLEFSCPSCRTRAYDGGLCKKVTCRCGKVLLRNESEQIL